MDTWEIMKKSDSTGIDFKSGKGIFFFKVQYSQIIGLGWDANESTQHPHRYVIMKKPTNNTKTVALTCKKEEIDLTN